MEVAVLAPLACAALDTALDASGGAMPVLACGSGRKLKTALTRSLKPSQFSPAKPALGRDHRIAPTSMNAGVHVQSSFQQAVFCRDFSRLSDSHLSDITRPFSTQPSAVPNPRSSEACSMGMATWLCDPGSLLAPGNASSIEDMLDHVNASTGVEFAAVILNDLRGTSDSAHFRHFGVKLFNEWGVGSAAHNNGVVLLLFKDARRLEIVTGVGMSDALPDGWLLKMQMTHMAPLFKDGRHAEGILAGVHAIQERLAEHAPHSWRQSEVNAIEDGSFGGGKGRPQVPSPSSSATSSALWPWCVLAAALGWSILPSEDQQVQQLKDRIKQLEEDSGRREFHDAKGNTLPWPYATAPGRMAGLAYIQDQYEHYAFNLAEKGQLSVEALGNGFGRNSLELKLRNHLDKPIEVYLPAGSFFVPRNDCRKQPLLLQAPVRATLLPGEEHPLQLSTFCGDSGASVPGNTDLVLAPYKLSQEHLGDQLAVWRWSAKHQRPSTEMPCSGASDILQESFGISPEDLEEVRSELTCLITEGEAHRKQKMEEELSEARLVLARRELELARARAAQTSRHGAGGGSRSFGGGCSSGGGAGCSW
mmetsp:Transcript_98036/g.238535  ORF Transcript_98036/g.238535 Transcript_98036/m.238535 type:complete len:590 (-) Transcript_98036:225-1994(-)